MKKKLAWYVAGVLILGLALLAVSCGGTTSAPTEEPAVEEPAVEEPAAEEPAKEEPATPTGGPPAITHPLEGRDDCLMCHGEAGVKPVPADHTGRTNDTCATCHQPAE